MEWINSFFEVVVHVVDVTGLCLLVLGFARGTWGWVRLELAQQPWETRLIALRVVRCVIGIHILYALELMIVSDIIDSYLSVVDLELEEKGFFESQAYYGLIKLGLIVVIRTIIDYFLSKELEAVHESSIANAD